jgi:hypothetical protein
MYIWRTKVPVGAEIVIGRDNGNGHHFVGFIEESAEKTVKIEESIYDDMTRTTCKSCDIYFQQAQVQHQYQTSYKHLFLAHPEMCVDFLTTVDVKHLLGNTYFFYEKEYRYVYRPYADVMSPKYFVDLLIKWGDYEKFVNMVVKTYQFEREVLNPVAYNIYKNFNKCKGYLFESRNCKKEIFNFDKKVTCSHNTLIWTQELWDNKYHLYDSYTDNACSLPNVYSCGEICWGSRSNPQNLEDARHKFWSTPFNGDLLLSSHSDTTEMIEGYGFDLSDFYSYDEDFDEYDYDDDPRHFNANEIIQIIRQGGDNSVKGCMDLDYDTFNIAGVSEILVVENGRKKISEFADLIEEDFLYHTDQDDLYLFLINEIPGLTDVWTAYLPTDNDEGEYIQIDLNQLKEYTGDIENDDSH